MFRQLLLSVVNELISFVLQVDHFAGLLILRLVGFSLIDHALNIVIAKTAGRANSNVLLLASGLVFSGNIKDTVSINIESDFNLGVATGSHGNAGKLKVTKLLVVL